MEMAVCGHIFLEVYFSSMLGYWGKLLRVNLTTKKITTEDIPDETIRKFLGGAGFGAEILLRETPANCDPLSTDNKLVFSIGPMQAVAAPGSGKWEVSTVSPLSGACADSAGTGRWATAFKRCGYEAIIVEGMSETPVYLYINDDGAELRDASHLWGLDTHDTSVKIKEELGNRRINALNIGPGGEIMHPIANITCDGHSFAGRGGAGAVMGSKKLKAIAAWGTKKVPCFDREAAEAFSKELFKVGYELGAGERNFGTSRNCIGAEKIGDMPIRYWRGDQYEAQVKRMCGPYMNEMLNVKPLPCENCPIGCHRHIDVDMPWGEHLNTNGPEYEVVGMMGTSVMIDNLFYISKANDLTNLAGIDCISAGAWVGFLMECYEYGWLTDEDFDGRPFKWGDGEALIYATEKICKLEGIGRIFKGGIVGAAKEIGRGADKIIVHSKNFDYPAHDPRCAFPMIIGYATNSRGACHTRSGAVGFAHGNGMPAYGLNFSLDDRFVIEGAGRAAAIAQDARSHTNCLSICQMLERTALTTNNQVKMMKLLTGEDFSVMDLFHAGTRTNQIQRVIGCRNGIRRVDDNMPEKMKIPALVGGRVGNPAYTDEMFQKGLDDYYNYRKWNKNGIPTPEALTEFGLEDYVRYIPEDN